MHGSLPKLKESFFQERAGVNEVARQLNVARLIWREAPHPDVGIDGYIEYVNTSGYAPGLLVAAQIKSGQSYFNDRTDDAILFVPDPKHAGYWAHFSIPVILILHDPSSDNCHFVDVRNMLRNAGESTKISVPIIQVICPERREDLFAAYGPIKTQSSIPDIFRTMISHADRHQASHLQLFLAGLIDIGRKVFFGMDLYMNILECSVDSISISQNEFDFLDAYVGFLSAQRLIHIDYADYLYDRDQRKLVPISIWTLTERGRQLAAFSAFIAKSLSCSPDCAAESYLQIGDSYKLNDLICLQRALTENIEKLGSLYKDFIQAIHTNSEGIS